MTKAFQPGNKVYWTYKHHLNSRQFTRITKEGIFMRVVKERANYPVNGIVKAVVQFKGNKRSSTVPLSELETSKS